MQLSRSRCWRRWHGANTVIFRGTPLILQMVFAYDALRIIASSCPRSSRQDWRWPATRRHSSLKCFAPVVSVSIAGRWSAGQALGMTPSGVDAAGDRRRRSGR